MVLAHLLPEEELRDADQKVFRVDLHALIVTLDNLIELGSEGVLLVDGEVAPLANRHVEGKSGLHDALFDSQILHVLRELFKLRHGLLKGPRQQMDVVVLQHCAPDLMA